MWDTSAQAHATKHAAMMSFWNKSFFLSYNYKIQGEIAKVDWLFGVQIECRNSCYRIALSPFYHCSNEQRARQSAIDARNASLPLLFSMPPSLFPHRHSLRPKRKCALITLLPVFIHQICDVRSLENIFLLVK